MGAPGLQEASQTLPRHLLDASGAWLILTHLEGVLGRLGEVLGGSMGRLGASWGRLGASWGSLGPDFLGKS